ncbi:GGDEF domain-containing protein [Rhizobium herbae]|uniref:diguanylate cyclase n=1 Tax=Rhizobium herbae TaxID=508661 RepID=A0ABS4EHJ4_9HYPH|nr:GGDEF domain-containing protein [Rhizobium herbae]MBP1857408.1 diguanylate cyclase (GGDEF)-like protein [Rhizobium herbae]
MSFLSAIAVISLVVMFPVLLSLRTTGVPGIARFCAACALAALAASVSLAASVAPAWFHTVGGATLTVAACLLTLKGFREFLGRPPLGIWPVAITLAGLTMVLLFFSYAVESLAARVSVGAGFSSLICLLIGASIVRHWPKERAIAPYMLFCCVTAFAVATLHALRAATVTTGFDAFGSAAEPLWTTAILAARALVMPLFFLGIILMLHGWVIANLRHMIAHDDLTGALSRRAFMTELERIFSAEKASGRQTAFMLLDLDRFKQINDLHGHAGGDVALAHFTRTVRETLAGRGILGRLGGEEFGIAMRGIGRLEAAEIAEAICTAVRTTPASAKGTSIAMTVSIGIAMADPGGSLAEAMVQADVALYEAKAMGRDRLSIAGSLHAASAASARALAGAAAQMRAATAGAIGPARPLSSTG